MSATESFKSAMRDAGIEPPDSIVTDGKLQRFSSGDGKSKNSWYVFFDDCDLPAGSFGCWKRGISETWCGKVTRTLSPEEKRAYAKRMEDARKMREEEAAKVAADCRAWCLKTWESAPPAPADHPYLLKKKVPPHGLRILRTQDDSGALMVPIKDSGQVIHGIQFIGPDGSKVFKTGTVKAGNCFRIGTIKDDTVIIAEGLATASTVHEATGHCVLVAFDAGNLLPVAEVVRAARPNMKIIIAADNDAWLKITDNEGRTAYKKVPCNHPITGKRCVNTGITKGTEAMKAVNGLLAVPSFPNVDTHPTDWNDLYILEGIEEVARQFDAVFNPPQEAPEEHEEHHHEDGFHGEDDHDDLESPPFQCLGYDHNTYYYLPRGSNQVIPLRAEQHSKSHFMTLAPLNYWEMMYPGKQGANFDAATNALIRFQERKGVYDRSRLRGRGAWEDAGRSVLHLGNVMHVDGQLVEPAEIKSHYIYEAAAAMEYDTPCSPLPTAEANKFIKLCDMLSWERPIYGRLLAGWCLIAPVCGALKWRPHVHVTGGSGAGKSWTIKNIVALTVGPSALQVVGSTTAASIRQELASDARPVIHDEFEAEGQASMKRIQEELELARACSSDSEALTLKGGADGRAKVYRTRAAFCFASIGVNVQQQADVSRVTVLSLFKNERISEEARQHHFDELCNAWAELLTEEYCCALRARIVRLIPVVRKNAETFARAAGVMLGQRTGDQIGALLAGAYAAFSENEITLEKAKEWIGSQDWSEYSIKQEQMDEYRCLVKILQTILRVQGTRGTSYDLSIGELISIANNGQHSDVTTDAADMVLKRHGIRVYPYDAAFRVSNTHTAIENWLEKTPWSKNWAQLLARLPGARKTETTRFAAGIPVSKAVELPLTLTSGEGE